jgi:DNA-binding GntR family transcriptional regulator
MDDSSAHLRLKVERPNKTLRSLALDKLRNAILDFQFRPGDRLVERNLCEALGVSRSIVREVLRHLESEGLVVTPPHQSPTVFEPDLDTTEQIYELRMGLEGMAARAAARLATPADIKRLQELSETIRDALKTGDGQRSRQATSDFYETLFLCGGKKVAWLIVQSLYARIAYLRGITIKNPGRTTTGPAEMQRIVDAVKSRNEKAAERACVEHVRHAAEIAFNALKQNNSPQSAAVDAVKGRAGASARKTPASGRRTGRPA